MDSCRRGEGARDIVFKKGKVPSVNAGTPRTKPSSRSVRGVAGSLTTAPYPLSPK